MTIFRFEDIGAELPLVPLAARRALDAAGRKLSLPAWQALPLARRGELCALGAPEQVDVARVLALLDAAVPAATAIAPVSDALAAPSPELVTALGHERPLAAEAWAKLTALERFALTTAARGRSGRARDAYDEIVAAARLTHLGPGGAARMVDVADKPATHRRAVAAATVRMRPETARLARAGGEKGDVLAAARIAGIMAAKRTPELVPLCHTVALSRVAVELTVDVDAVRIEATAEAVDRTGVEMEALVAASVAALTVYDMLKAVERGMRIDEVVLLEKSGGRSGHYRREER